MDGGPFRTSRPVERRTAGRPEPAHRPPEESRQAAGESSQHAQPAAHHVPAARHTPASKRGGKAEKPFFKRFLWPAIGLLVVLLIAAGIFLWSNKSGGMAIDSSKYQAVFFTNGQVYFGKLHAGKDGYMRLTDIFYLQSQQTTPENSGNPQATSTDQNNVQLIKLGDEIHGPEDEMIISKDQVLFYENLKPDGKVSQSIQKFKESK